MTLDLAVSRAVAQSQLLERALHSTALWYIDIGGVRAEATREAHEHGVTFTACFTNVPADSDAMTLLEGETARAARPFQHPVAGPFCLSWDLSLTETISA